MRKIASWKDRIKNINTSSRIDIAKEFEKIQRPSIEEPAIINSNIKDINGYSPTVICRENGCIELFAKRGLGIRIDPNLNSIELIADNIKLHSNVTDLYSSPFMGIRWNKQPLNLQSQLYGMSPSGPVTVTPGTLIPYNTMAQDSLKMISNFLKGFGSRG